MDSILQPGFFGLSLVLFVFIYTLYLVRSGRLSAHMAMSWVIAEVAFIVVMFFDGIRSSVKAFLGGDNAPYSLFLLGVLWVVFLMLESLTRISSLTFKLKEVNQELAILRERMDRQQKQNEETM
jgi:hypothetical protein